MINKFFNLDILAVTDLKKRITSDLKLLKMKELLIRLVIRAFIQLGLDQVFYKG